MLTLLSIGWDPPNSPLSQSKQSGGIMCRCNANGGISGIWDRQRLPPLSMTSREIVPPAMTMALLAESKAGFCNGIGCWFGSETCSQFSHGSQSGTFYFLGLFIGFFVGLQMGLAVQQSTVLLDLVGFEVHHRGWLLPQKIGCHLAKCCLGTSFF